ncbi:MAG TPA: peptidoglycan endopeptidase [Glutamicibacter sp.]|uniref:Cell wall lytic activity n=1 Tax=Glutamicibacter arilaitensis TaxID=256701 RepID=A0A2N7S1I0_9MICC|nr:cell wall lytic activity [Glutamicibacter arilaitensis]TFH55245.1 peptidoglycan endopeptidase [Glutamicibacter arilaitensis]HCH49019.1 peptidoglycan endopeptidase [Glutamicibacter sp.]HCJ53585.1 peptidoglycan endopeptidase [Glutamicibacter sp.]HCM95745.1 peptidoglycan endopeptidase [Glutamicibacter sp.]
MSQAVASNAGSVGRQAAVVAAASGLIVTLGVPGQATAPRDVSASPVDTINPERVAVKAVKVAADKKADIAIERASFTAEEKPEPVVIAVSNDITPTTRSNNSGSSDSMAPMTRQSRSGGQESAPQQKAQPKAETTVQSSNLSGIAATAAKYVGVPYVWGGNGPSGWDCSGFVKYVYAQHGINIARGTSAILGSGQFVRTSNPKPGDLVFQNGGGHVGIYLGGGQMIGAQNPTVDTMIHSVSRNPLYGYYTLAG